MISDGLQAFLHEEIINALLLYVALKPDEGDGSIELLVLLHCLQVERRGSDVIST